MLNLQTKSISTVQTVGAVAGILAFFGVVVLWFATPAALNELAVQAAALKKDAEITIDFDPLGSMISGIFSITGLIILMVLVIIVLVVLLVTSRKTTR